MIVHIDYLTIRIPAFISGMGSSTESRRMARLVVRSEFPDAVASWLLNREFVNDTPKNGHAVVERDPVTSICLKYGGEHPYVWVEIPGRACQHLQTYGMMMDVIQWVHAHIRRIDIACDIGDVPPEEFTSAGYSARFKSGSVWKSLEGETVYVGSMKSERYCRVYRYHEPHPRANVTRVEYVYQSDAAPVLAGYIKENGLKAAVTGLGEIFGWQHKAWNAGSQVYPALPVLRQKKGDGTRVRWILTQAIPGIAKAIREGLISREMVENAIEMALKNRNNECDDG